MTHVSLVVFISGLYPQSRQILNLGLLLIKRGEEFQPITDAISPKAHFICLSDTPPNGREAGRLLRKPEFPPEMREFSAYLINRFFLGLYMARHKPTKKSVHPSQLFDILESLTLEDKKTALVMLKHFILGEEENENYSII